MNNSQNKNLLTEGSIWKKLMGFAFPLFLGNLFQQLYNTADSLIVGNFLGSDALAAVSSSGSLTFLLVGFFQGMAMGAGVIIARYFGARQQKELQKAIHTTVAFGILCGILLTISGVVLAPKILVLMKTPADILPKSTLYFQVYAMGSLGLVLYNAQRTNHCPECRTQPGKALLWNTGNYHHWNGCILLCGNTESHRRIICF